MKAVVDAVAASIFAEVTGANTWTFQKSDPVWRNPAKGKVLNVYATTVRPGEFRTTGSVEDVGEIIVEYTEAAPNQLPTLSRDEAAERAAYDTADLIRTWARNHQTFATTPPVHRFDLIRVDYAPGVVREGMVRYCRLTFEAAVQSQYG